MAVTCPRCRQATLIRVHAHDECPTCRFVDPCCNGDTAEACGAELLLDRPALAAAPAPRA